jgi:hypothetical protein
MDLIDAVSAMTTADSVVKVSLSDFSTVVGPRFAFFRHPCFRLHIPSPFLGL